MFDFLQVVIASVASIFNLVNTPFVGNTAITPTPTPVQTVEIVKAAGTYSYEGYGVNVVMEFPGGGGTITGNLDGDCTGTIDGNYAGWENGNLTGTAQANCTVAIFSVSATADLTGKVLLEQKKINVDFQGKASDFTHNGSITLNFLE